MQHVAMPRRSISMPMGSCRILGTGCSQNASWLCRILSMRRTVVRWGRAPLLETMRMRLVRLWADSLSNRLRVFLLRTRRLENVPNPRLQFIRVLPVPAWLNPKVHLRALHRMGVPRGKVIGIRPAPNHGIGIAVVGDMENTNAFALFSYCVISLALLVAWCSRRPGYLIFADYV